MAFGICRKRSEFSGGPDRFLAELPVQRDAQEQVITLEALFGAGAYFRILKTHRK